jgi:hypothetical protein
MAGEFGFDEVCDAVADILREGYTCFAEAIDNADGINRLHIVKNEGDCEFWIEVWGNFSCFKVSYESYEEYDEVELGNFQDLVDGIVSSVANLSEEYVDVAPLERRTQNVGEFSHLPVLMQLKTVKGVAKKYGISLSGIKVTIQRNEDLLELLELRGAAAKNRIDLFPGAFVSEEELARTLYHELLHVQQYRKYGVAYVQNNRVWFEDLAYSTEAKMFGKRRKND